MSNYFDRMFGGNRNGSTGQSKEIVIQRLATESQFTIKTPGFTSPSARFDTIEGALKAIKPLPSDNVRILDVRDLKIHTIHDRKQTVIFTDEAGKVCSTVTQFEYPSKY